MSSKYLEEYRNLRDDAFEVINASPIVESQSSSTSCQRAGTPSSDFVSSSSLPQAREEALSESGTQRQNTGGVEEGENLIEGAVEVDANRNPRPRKGHKKSRQGCFNCKRRKIKA
jgi:hypothetical protein